MRGKIVSTYFYPIYYECGKEKVILKDKRTRDHLITLHQKTCLLCKDKELSGERVNSFIKNGDDITKTLKKMDFIHEKKII